MNIAHNTNNINHANNANIISLPIINNNTKLDDFKECFFKLLQINNNKEDKKFIYGELFVMSCYSHNYELINWFLSLNNLKKFINHECIEYYNCLYAYIFGMMSDNTNMMDIEYDYDTFIKLLEKGADPNYKRNKILSLLGYVSLFNYIDLVAILVFYGAELSEGENEEALNYQIKGLVTKNANE